MRPRNYWTFERCKEDALKFEYKYDFRIESPSCYSVVCKNKWVSTLCAHMKKKRNKPKFLNKEICCKEALKYSNKKEFRKECPKIYDFICKNRWLEELCSHQNQRKKAGYWTKNRCKEEASKYKTKSEFMLNSSSAYNISVRNKWLDDICVDYEILGTHYKRFIYAYEFSDNQVYVGLTYNIKQRKRRHKESGTVFNHIQKTGIIPRFKQLIVEPVLVEKAVLLEEKYLNDYIEQGWTPLNKAKTGGIGGGKTKWDFNKIQEVALKYTNKSDFNKDYSWACVIARKRGWFDEITSHMVSTTKPANYWNYERCREEAQKYTSKRNFELGCTSAYQSAKRNKWLEDICSHMNSMKPNGYYTLEKCIDLAKECYNTNDYKHKYISAHTYMYKNKWKDIIKPHFKENIKN